MKQLRWDFIALLSVTLAGLWCHFSWGLISPSLLWASVATMIIALVCWSAWLWSRVSLWLTKFFLLAAVVDLLAEGVLQPFHGSTVTAKLICQMMLFAAYVIYLVALRPLDVWLARRR